MKRIIAIAALAGFSGCGMLTPDPSVKQLSAQQATELQKAQEVTSQECFKYQIELIDKDITFMAQLSQEQIYNMMILEKVNHANDNMLTLSMGVLEFVSGGKVKGNQGVCSQSNIWDYFAASDAAKYELAGKIVDGSVRLASAVIDGALTYWLADAGGSVASGGGISLNKSDGNIIVVSKDSISEQSSKSVSLSNSPVKKDQVQVGNDDSQIEGTGDSGEILTGTDEVPLETTEDSTGETVTVTEE